MMPQPQKMTNGPDHTMLKILKTFGEMFFFRFNFSKVLLGNLGWAMQQTKK